jgi:hypothetical protein
VYELSDPTELTLNALGETVENNRWTKLFEDKLGIKINYLWVAKGAQYNQKLQMSIASGTIPDFMKVGGATLDGFNAFAMLANTT